MFTLFAVLLIRIRTRSDPKLFVRLGYESDFLGNYDAQIRIWADRGGVSENFTFYFLGLKFYILSHNHNVLGFKLGNKFFLLSKWTVN